MRRASGTTWSTGTPNLMPPCAGGDVGMGVGGDVGIDPDADPRPAARAASAIAAERGQLLDATRRCTGRCRPRPRRSAPSSVFPTPLKTMLLGLEARGERAGQLAAGDDVGAAPRSRSTRSTARLLLAFTA